MGISLRAFCFPSQALLFSIGGRVSYRISKRHLFYRIITLIWHSGSELCEYFKYFEAMGFLAEYRDEMWHRSFGMYIASEDSAKINNTPTEAAGIPIRSMGLTQLRV